MKFTCTQENLAQGLSVVAHIASKSTNLPILNNILLRAEKGGITLLATNLEIGITRRIRGKVEEEGQCTVPAKIFAEYVQCIEGEAVSLALEGTTITIISENAETKLRGLSAEEFPLIPQIEKKASLRCAAAALAEAIGQVAFAAAADDTRPEISGVLLRAAGATLTLAATDSYRLAETAIALAQPTEEELSAIVPVRTLQEASRMLHSGAAEASIALTQNQIAFSNDEGELISRLIDGQYPDYRQIVPTTEETSATFVVAEMQRAVRASGLFSRPGINDVALQIDPDKQQLSLNATNAQVGEHHRTISAKVQGVANTIVFNNRYLLDGLANLNSEEARLLLTNNANPGVLRPLNEHAAYTYIIMPIKQ